MKNDGMLFQQLEQLALLLGHLMFGVKVKYNHINIARPSRAKILLVACFSIATQT